MSNQPIRIHSISEFHQLRDLPAPQHPLISVVDYSHIRHKPGQATSWTLDFYSISIKRNAAAKIKYGQKEYDFDEGVMFFIAPGQVFSVEITASDVSNHSGWMLLVHPDFLWNNSLAKNIKQYDFFDYAVNEALFLSEKEEEVLAGIINNIRQEYHSNIDKFSRNIIVSQIETLLNYSERFYQRQFITRDKANHQLLEQLEQLLSDCLTDENLLQNGLLTVQYIAQKLLVSPNYLRQVLKTVTGMNTQQHIHEKLIEKAKEKLSTTTLSVSEIAYELGFEHSQSFSKLFKSKTNVSPSEFRNSFN